MLFYFWALQHRSLKFMFSCRPLFSAHRVEERKNQEDCEIPLLGMSLTYAASIQLAVLVTSSTLQT